MTKLLISREKAMAMYRRQRRIAIAEWCALAAIAAALLMIFLGS